METMRLLVDSHHGIYVPQIFAKTYIGWDMDYEDETILQSGPDREHYWEAWDTVLSSAKYTDAKGVSWTLHQDGDLWAVREDHVWEEDNDSE